MSSHPPGKHALVFVAVTVLLDIIGFGLIIPVLPALLVGLTGEGVSQAAIYGGWLAFVYAVMQFVCAPLLGNLSDRFGRRVVLLFAVGALGIDYIVMGFAPTLGWLFFGRTIAGIAGASFTPAYACVADISPPEKRAQNFGLISASFGVGFILGPALGGLLGELGPRAPFFAAACLSLANFVYGYFMLPETLAPEKRRAFDWKRANPLGTLTQIRKHPVLPGLLSALFLWMVAHQVMPATWTFFTKLRFGWSEATIGASLALAGVVMAISQASLLRVLVPRLGERRAALDGNRDRERWVCWLRDRDRGLDDVRLARDLVLRCARHAEHQRADVASSRPRCARGAPGSGREPLLAQLDRRAAAHDAALRPLRRAGSPRLLPRRGVHGSVAARNHLFRDLLVFHARAGCTSGRGTAGVSVEALSPQWSRIKTTLLDATRPARAARTK
jgi:DHA1 family tetracycline resistance protein-like MFS transporter